MNIHLVTGMVMALAAGAAAADVPRAEHPRPDMMRAQWMTLNGEWEFAETDDDNAVFLEDAAYPDKIIVPFCRESKLSGLGRTGFVRNVWYRRAFEMPGGDWTGKRIRLHVGACDWRTKVWVNGTPAGSNTGGSAPFAFDITPLLRPGANTVIIHAFDDVRSGLQAGGKQSEKPESYGCMYTRTTGIWQSVWLEAVGTAFIEKIRITPDVPNKRVLIWAQVDGAGRGMWLSAKATLGDEDMGHAMGFMPGGQASLVMDLKEARLWAPESPTLYNLHLAVTRKQESVDSLETYFGLRSVTVQNRAILLNDRPVFQRTVLDQGFYPDGIWTAPTDEALRGDIELSMAAGFNGARLHQKVFEPRFLYWADKLGYLVWGEFPNWGLHYNKPAVNLPVVNEWRALLERDYNHPSIIGWCPFNETPPDAEALQNVIVNLTRAYDPTRPVIESSGYHHGHPDPMLLDAHDYDQNPETFKARWDSQCGPDALPARYSGGASRPVPFFVSEYGGIGWDVGQGAWGYGNNPKTLEEFYTRYEGLTNALLDNRYMFGFCYTQLTNVEQEQNGIYTYDRKPKFDTARIRAINMRRAAYEDDPPLEPEGPAAAWRVLVGAHPDGESAKPWRFNTETPKDGWEQPGFDDGEWKEGLGGFGEKGGWEGRIRTKWRGKDLWLRQGFDWDAAAFSRAMLVIHYDNATRVYLNGGLLWEGGGWNDGYQGKDVTERAKALLKPGGNLIAVHCHQDDGGQFIDLALITTTGSAGMNIVKSEFGTLPDGRTADLYTLTNAKGAKAVITNYGAIVQQLWMPDKNGAMADVVLGYDTLDSYVEKTPYFGCIVGRYGNRIANAKFTLDGKEHQLAANDGPNSLHGGLKGFDKVLWDAREVRRLDAVGVALYYRSPDGEEGYPGNLDLTVTYWLTDNNALEIAYEGTTDAPTPLNPTHHGYFNLDGHDSGDILGHEMMLNATRFTPIDATLIPTGELRPVKGTPFDFTTPTPIGERVNNYDEQLKFGLGYDHNWVIEQENQDGPMNLAARVRGPESGRVMEVLTSEPGVQFYCGNFLDGTNIGKGGHPYEYRNGFCLETQHFPDSPNKPDFPRTILRPGETYRQRTIYQFTAE